MSFILLACSQPAFSQRSRFEFEGPVDPGSVSDSLMVSIASGRSPQAAKSSSLHPRILRAFLGDGDTQFSYVANVDGDNELEMIKWNEEKKRYDFKAYSGFQGPVDAKVLLFSAGNHPSLKPLSTSTCIRCHQNEGPIFPRQSWKEVDEQSRNDVIMFDESVRRGNRAMQSHRYCAAVCRNSDPNCRKKLLLEALKNKFSPMQFISNVVETSKALRGRAGLDWARTILSSNDFSYISSVLPDRDVLPGETGTSTVDIVESARRETRHLMGKIDENVPRHFNSQVEFEATGGIFTYLDRDILGGFTPFHFNSKTLRFSGIKINEPSSPLFIRPRQGHLTPENIGEELPQITRDCFQFSVDIRGLVQALGWETVQSKLTSSTCTAELWNSRFDEVTLSAILRSRCNPNRVDTPAAMPEKELKVSEATLQRSEASPFVTAAALPHLSLIERQATEKLFQLNCFRCHGNGKPIDLKLGQDDVAHLAKYRNSAGMTAFSRITQKEMPPDINLSVEEQNLMLRYLQDIK